MTSTCAVNETSSGARRLHHAKATALAPSHALQAGVAYVTCIGGRGGRSGCGGRATVGLEVGPAEKNIYKLDACMGNDTLNRDTVTVLYIHMIHRCQEVSSLTPVLQSPLVFAGSEPVKALRFKKHFSH